MPVVTRAVGFKTCSEGLSDFLNAEYLANQQSQHIFKSWSDPGRSSNPRHVYEASCIDLRMIYRWMDLKCSVHRIYRSESRADPESKRKFVT